MVANFQEKVSFIIFTGVLSGKYHYSVKGISEYPAVGDFAMIDRTNNSRGNGVIHHTLFSKSVFARETVGTKEDIQIVATNIDTVFIYMSLNDDYREKNMDEFDWAKEKR